VGIGRITNFTLLLSVIINTGTGGVDVESYFAGFPAKVFSNNLDLFSSFENIIVIATLIITPTFCFYFF
jgi:hypothetical protein